MLALIFAFAARLSACQFQRVTKYARDTTVPIDRSKVEIERTLQRYGATEFAYGTKPGCAMVGFVLQGRRIRFRLPMRDLNDTSFTKTPTGLRRSAEAARKEWEQNCRSRWRALALAIKAKLEAVESGIATIEEEFLGYMVLPSGETFAEWAAPQLEQSASKMPPLLPN